MTMKKKREYLQSKKIMVTGGGGFIGSRLVLKLQEMGAKCISLNHVDFDIVSGDVKTLQACDILVHLAAYVNPVESWNNFQKSISVNVDGTRNMLDFCKKNNVDVVYMNTYVYGNPKILPINEEAAIRPGTPYSITKMMGEDMCKFYFQNFGLNITSLRVFNVYGDSNNDNFLITKIINQYKNNSNEINVFSSNTRRDFIHVDDVICAIIQAILKLKGFQIYNIGSGESYSSKDIFNVLNELTNKNLTFSCNENYRENDVENIICDYKKAKININWSPKISLYNGIKRALNE
jgi:GDP-4-dehydro-6-deoxy-D-mannose reductase